MTPPVRLLPHFSMQFIHEMTGIRFDERYFGDAEHRHGQDILLHRALHDFCLRHWPEAAPSFEAEPPWTIGVGQAYIITAALFGARIRVFADFHPDCTPEPLAWVRRPEDIVVPDVANTEPLKGYLAEYERLAALHGRDRVSLPGFGGAGVMRPELKGFGMHSPLTTAYRLRGLELFADMEERPELARRLFDAIRDASLAIFDLLAPRLGLGRDLVFFAACCSSLVSPGVWRRWERPAMEEIAGRYGARIAIHSCGRSTHVLAEALSMPGLVELHPGGGTDLALARRLAPDLPLMVIPDSVAWSRAAPGEAAAEARTIMEAGTPGPLAINFAIEAGIRTDTIAAVRGEVAAFNLDTGRGAPG